MKYAAEQALLGKLQSEAVMEDLLTGRVRVPIVDAEDRGQCLSTSTSAVPRPTKALGWTVIDHGRGSSRLTLRRAFAPASAVASASGVSRRGSVDQRRRMANHGSPIGRRPTRSDLAPAQSHPAGGQRGDAGPVPERPRST